MRIIKQIWGHTNPLARAHSTRDWHRAMRSLVLHQLGHKLCFKGSDCFLRSPCFYRLSKIF